MDYAKEELLKMYEDLAKARSFSLKMSEAARAGAIRTSFHSPYGQEAMGVGIVNAMDEKDWFAPTHRTQTVGMFRFDLYQFIAEIFAKKDGLHRGVSFDFHCTDYSRKMLCMTAVLGGTFPQYTGFAWALKRLGKDEIVVASQGDGGCSEGTVSEAYNLATLFKVPIVFVIENNEWAMTVPIKRQTVNFDIARRAEPYGLPIQIIDGNDVLAVRKAMDKAVAMAHQGQPNVVEMKTLRWDAHFVGQGNAYRDDVEKIQYSMEHDDCLKRYEQYLLENKVATREWMDKIKAEKDAELDELIERAKNAPIATKEEIFQKEYIYATVETGGEL